ncbi:MAG: ClpP-like prohead protease/major capsid protein fusion protein [Rudaea sp.]
MKRNFLAAAIIDCMPGITPAHIFAAADGAGKPHIAPVMALRPANQLGSQYELIIYGDIGESWYGNSVLAADVVKQLNELPPTVAQINVRINSYGGSVSDGLAIYNALKRMGATKVVTVDGVAMSIASLIAMCGDTIEMPEASLLMIHAPWGMAVGNSSDMREFADFLDVYAEAMAGAYVAKSGQTRDQIMALLTDGKDHTYTASQARDLGFCDVMISATPEEETPGEETTPDEELETATAAFVSGMQRFTARSPSMLAAISAAVHNSRLLATASPSDAAGASGAATQPAQGASTGGFDMFRRLNGRLVAMAPQTDPGAGGGSSAATAPDAAAIAAKAKSDAEAALKTRNDLIVAALKPSINIKAIADLQTQALSDPSMTPDQVNAKALAILSALNSPNPGSGADVVAGADQRDKTRLAATNFLLVRAGGHATRGLKPEEISGMRQGNPFNGMSMLEMARACVVNAGLNPAGWSKDRIVAAAITESQSDYPHIFENVMYKVLLNSYNSIEQTWRQFCRVSSVADFRTNNRYYMGGFSDLLPVDETGEYQDGTFTDAEKETITATTQGRILNLSREMIVNDDMGVFTGAAQKLGNAGARGLDKKVYSVITTNGNLTDGVALFHATHGNLAASGAVVGSQTFDDLRVAMGSQLDPSGNDFLGIVPMTWVGPLKYKGDTDVVNGSRYNVDVTNKFEIPNKSFGIFEKVVGTPRLTDTAWYAFASPDIEPVIEVAFLEGIQEPQVASEQSFRSNGMAWRVIFDYGVAPVGFRGAYKNPGA